MKLRCAIYARFSSDKQSAASIVDQVRKCREYAQAHGWEVLDDHIYSDEAISGATLATSDKNNSVTRCTSNCSTSWQPADASELQRYGSR